MLEQSVNQRRKEVVSGRDVMKRSRVCSADGNSEARHVPRRAPIISEGASAVGSSDKGLIATDEGSERRVLSDEVIAKWYSKSSEGEMTRERVTSKQAPHSGFGPINVLRPPFVLSARRLI